MLVGIFGSEDNLKVFRVHTNGKIFESSPFRSVEPKVNKDGVPYSNADLLSGNLRPENLNMTDYRLIYGQERKAPNDNDIGW